MAKDNPVYVDFNPNDGNRYEFRQQDNGDIYVYLRPKHWDRRKKSMVYDKSTLLGVLNPNDHTKLELIGQRKKAFLEAQEQADNASQDMDIIEVQSTKNVAMEIIDHLFEVSQIDAQVEASLEKISLVEENEYLIDVVRSTMRYMVLHQTAILDLFEISQCDHVYPCDKRISESTVGRVYEIIGRHPKGKMIFFQKRFLQASKDSDDVLFIAFDSSLISSYSACIQELRKTYGEDNAKTKSIKLFMLYEIHSRLPVAWFILPGNVTDTKALEYAIEELRVLGLTKFELVADAGFDCKSNREILEKNSISYLIRHPNRNSDVNKAFKDHLNELDQADRVDEEAHVAGIKVDIGDGRYLYLFKDMVQNALDKAEFISQLNSLKEEVLTEGWSRSKAEKGELKLINKYLVITEPTEDDSSNDSQANCREVSLNYEAINAYCGRLSTFSLISSCDVSPREAFKTYFLREKIEECYSNFKGDFDDRLRVHSYESLEGRMYVMFGSVCWQEYFQKVLTTIKNELSRFKVAHKDEKGYIQQVQAYTSLYSWLSNTSIKQIINWFEAQRETKIQTKANQHRWSDPIIKRDQLFLAFLGLVEFPQGFKELPSWEWIPQRH